MKTAACHVTVFTCMAGTCLPVGPPLLRQSYACEEAEGWQVSPDADLFACIRNQAGTCSDADHAKSWTVFEARAVLFKA